MYEERIYRRDFITGNLKGFEVVVKETDLFICAEKDLTSQAIESTLKYRSQIESYIEKHPKFKESLSPMPNDLFAMPIIKNMFDVTRRAGVGPMASVAGAMAEFIGTDLLKFSDEIIVENGGDIFVKLKTNRRIGIFAGKSSFSNKLTIEIEASKTPLGICTSSAAIGPSLSFGKTDATVVIAKSAAFADACATAIGNMVKQPEDIKKALEFAKKLEGLSAVLIVIADKLGVWGDIKMV